MRAAHQLSLLPRIAALYVERDGCYWDVPGVDAWDEARDARRYTGPWPVVAHPPCQFWVNLAHVNFKRYGGEHNRPGNDAGCFEAALAAVRTWGGVLEHPAFTRAWPHYGLLRPGQEPGWRLADMGGAAGPGWVCEVWQSAYGHKARKRTWLYAVGSNPPELRWERKAGTHQIGWFDRNKPTLSKLDASATPTAFREELIRVALEVSR